MLHEKSDDILRGLYKAASFVIQATVFRNTGKYLKHQNELLSVVSCEEYRIIKTFSDLKRGGKIDFDSMSEALFIWSKKWVSQSK